MTDLIGIHLSNRRFVVHLEVVQPTNQLHKCSSHVCVCVRMWIMSIERNAVKAIICIFNKLVERETNTHATR